MAGATEYLRLSRQMQGWGHGHPFYTGWIRQMIYPLWNPLHWSFKIGWWDHRKRATYRLICRCGRKCQANKPTKITKPRQYLWMGIQNLLFFWTLTLPHVIMLSKLHNESLIYMFALFIMMKAFVRVQNSSCNDEITALMHSTSAVIGYNVHRCNLSCDSRRPKYSAVINTFHNYIILTAVIVQM